MGDIEVVGEFIEVHFTRDVVIPLLDGCGKGFILWFGKIVLKLFEPTELNLVALTITSSSIGNPRC